jgi:hypothetical protein
MGLQSFEDFQKHGISSCWLVRRSGTIPRSKTFGENDSLNVQKDHGDRLKIGDLVFIWQASSVTGNDAGVYAAGRVTSTADSAIMIRYTLDLIASPILIPELVKSRLGDLVAIIYNGSTSFQLTVFQCDSLAHLAMAHSEKSGLDASSI